MRVPGKIAIWVFFLVFMAIVILQAGNYSYVQDNGHTNYGPSGTSAFLELVKRSGYKVTVDNSNSPKVAKTMVIPVSGNHRKTFASFLKSVKSDTTIIAFIVPDEVDEKSTPKTITNDITSEKVGELEPVQEKSETKEKPILADAETVTLLSASPDGTTIAKVSTKNDLRLVQLLDAACITNQNLEKVNNASIAMGLVSMGAKAGDAITYVGSFSTRDSEDSLLAKLGRPYEAAWSQLLIFVLVVFITLTIRFGLAPETRAKQRGARELVDGLAWMTRRKRNARWALRAVFDRVLSELERRHRISREQIIQRPDLYLTQEQAIILKDVEAATMNDISEQEAIQHAMALKRLV